MTVSEVASPGEGQLQRRMSRLTMVALTFAILKYGRFHLRIRI